LCYNKEQKITITTGSTLTTEVIDRMVNEAKQHTEQDKKNREVIEELNKLEGLIYAVRKTLNENKGKVSDKEVSNIEASLKTAESKLTLKDINVLKSAYSDLTKVSHAFTELLYKESKKDSSSNQDKKTSSVDQNDSNNKDDEASVPNKKEENDSENIVDADFQEKK
jgi:molecular chaperone DnaK